MASDAPIHRPTVPVTMPHCPVCGVELQLGSSGALDRWSCTAGHGLAMTVSESYERLQEDEIGRLWAMARDAAPGPMPSPFDGIPMRRFVLPYDADEVPEGQDGDGPDIGSLEIDVDVANQFVWLDAGALDQLPVDQPDAEPSAAELQEVADIAAQFGADIEAAARGRDGDDLTEELYRRVARHPGALSTLDRVGRTLTAY
jgi:Zn-finger nucleic acid-binding protein